VSRVLGALLLAAVAGGCGGGIEALDPRNPTLPPQSRLWIAGADDAVVIARASLEEARLAQGEVDRWAEDLRRRTELGDAELLTRRDAWIEAKRRYAAQQVELAEATLDLALARRSLANAQVAVAHDLGAYELEPLRQETVAAAGRVQGLHTAVRTGRAPVEAAATAFWQAYRRFSAGGGDTRPFWRADR
jgi:hypothetical protein